MIIEVFPPLVVGALKPSITFRSLGSLQLAPQFAPAHSPVRSSSLLPCPIAPYTPQVVGTPTHTWPLGASWSELGVSWELGARGASWSELEQARSELEQAGSKLEQGEQAGSELGVSCSEGSELERGERAGVRRASWE